MHIGSLPYLCTRNETMAHLHVATLTIQRELPMPQTPDPLLIVLHALIFRAS